MGREGVFFEFFGKLSKSVQKLCVNDTKPVYVWGVSWVFFWVDSPSARPFMTAGLFIRGFLGLFGDCFGFIVFGTPPFGIRHLYYTTCFVFVKFIFILAAS